MTDINTVLTRTKTLGTDEILSEADLIQKN